MFPIDIKVLAKQVVERYAACKRKLVVAESCTGGLVAGAITDIPGASTVLERGFVTYSNESKIDLLGVLPDLLERHGAVSPDVAEAMADGTLTYSHADVAVSVTGIAGPDGGTALKPVGLVYIGLAQRNGSRFHYKCNFKGDRKTIRLLAVTEALRLALTVTEEKSGSKKDPF